MWMPLNVKPLQRRREDWSYRQKTGLIQQSTYLYDLPLQRRREDWSYRQKTGLNQQSTCLYDLPLQRRREDSLGRSLLLTMTVSFSDVESQTSIWNRRKLRFCTTEQLWKKLLLAGKLKTWSAFRWSVKMTHEAGYLQSVQAKSIIASCYITRLTYEFVMK